MGGAHRDSEQVLEYARVCVCVREQLEREMSGGVCIMKMYPAEHRYLCVRTAYIGFIVGISTHAQPSCTIRPPPLPLA